MAIRAHSLDPLFRPRSIAVVGASATPGKVGSVLMCNLLGDPFGGVVYPVNPKRQAVHGVRCYPTLADVPEAVDLALLATPPATVPGLVRACADRGVKAAIVVSADLSAPGASGPALVAQIREVARGPLRVLGPDCLGVLRPPDSLNASIAAAMPARGHVTVLSQSGAICASILDWAQDRRIGFSAFVAAGAMADVDFADLIDYLGDDPQTHSIILHVESVGDVRRFLSAARAVARTKTLIAVKAGRTEPAARAVASHTGALAGSDAVFEAAFRRVGILRVDTIPDLFAMAEILALQPQPHGPALAILTNAGGPGVMATDALVLGGGQLAPISPATRAALDTLLPSWSRANPIDLLGDATPERYHQAVSVCARDPAMQGLLVLLTPQALTDPTETARQLVPFAHVEGKPVLASWMGGSAVEPGRAVLAQAGIPHFDSPEAAIAAFLHMAQYRRNQELLYERPRAQAEDWSPDQGRVRRILTAMRGDGRTLLTEVEAKELLAAYGIPVTQTVACLTAEEAVVAARRLGYPVVLKLLSRTVTHKSEAGGVVLNVTGDDAVRQAFDRIRSELEVHFHEVRFEGVTVQPMVCDPGHELIVGSSTDPQFGPVLLFGAGGMLAEVLQDRALGLPPLTGTLARRLMERTRVYKALEGVRGRRPVDLEALETLLVRFSRLVADFVEFAEIDVNLLLAGPGRVVALDARVLLAPSEAPSPPLAIRPYPNQLTAPSASATAAR
jgi:acetyltransferase